MAQYIQATPGTIAAAMGYSSQVPQSRYQTGQLGLANGGIAQLPYGGGTIAGGNIQGTPMGNRTGFGLFSKAKKRLKKLIPKEIAPMMMAAAPFMGPIAGPITAGLGSYKTYGKINPMAMAMSLAPHLKTAGYGDWGGGKSIRGLLTGQGKTGSGRGILGDFGNKIDASIFGKSPYVDTVSGDFMKGKEGFFGTGGGKIGIEDVFKTLTTDKKGDRTLKNVVMILATSTDYADALQRAKGLGMGEGDLPFSNQDEYMAAKARLTGTIPTKPLIAHGGRVGYNSGSNGGGVHDPLQQLVFLLGKRAQGTITPSESATLDKLIDDTGFMSQKKAHGGRVGNANGGIPNTRTGLQWGSDKGEGLGGEEVEADMRYEGGFMPYGEEPKADDVPARLSKDEFVFTDQAVAGAGDGDIDVGAERLYNVMKNLEQGGRLSEESEGIAAQEMEAMI